MCTDNIPSLTPISTVVAGYNHFLDNPDISGQALECSHDRLIPHPRAAYGNGPITKRCLAIWEPLFVTMHHEESGLPSTFPDGV
jgi:hypothetical protein